MAMVIGTNLASITTQRHLSNSRSDMNTAMERLSSGKRVNSAMDDAAGLAIIGKMTAQIEGLGMAVRNSSDGVSMLQTAEGGLQETTNILLRMRELAVQSSNGTYGTTNRAALNAEYGLLSDEVTRIAVNTQFNGNAVLNSTLVVGIQAGAQVGDQVSMSFREMDASALGLASGAAGAPTVEHTASTAAVTATAVAHLFSFAATTYVETGETASFKVNGKTYTQDFLDIGSTAAIKSQNTLQALGQLVVAGESEYTEPVAATGFAAAAGTTFELKIVAGSGSQVGQLQVTSSAGAGAGVAIDGTDILDSVNALAAIGSLDSALLDVANYRADLGGTSNRLNYTIENLMSRIENASAARSQIEDADFAGESANLAKAQVLQLAGTAMLAQANASGQSVLSLLK
jgi:flagellin